MPTGIQAFNPIAALDPELYAKQLMLQRQQALADQLYQQSAAPNPTFSRPASGGPYGVVTSMGIGNALTTP